MVILLKPWFMVQLVPMSYGIGGLVIFITKLFPVFRRWKQVCLISILIMMAFVEGVLLARMPINLFLTVIEDPKRS